jgi:hypothetical protein
MNLESIRVRLFRVEEKETQSNKEMWLETLGLG